MFRASRMARYITREHHPHADEVMRRTLTAPKKFDPVAAGLEVTAWGTFFATYGIIADWIYSSHLDMWDGTYGIEDDDDEDDE
jgi:hypothetical protein